MTKRDDVIRHLSMGMVKASRRWPAGSDPTRDKPRYVFLDEVQQADAFLESTGSPSYKWVADELDRIERLSRVAWTRLRNDTMEMYQRDILAYLI